MGRGGVGWIRLAPYFIWGGLGGVGEVLGGVRNVWGWGLLRALGRSILSGAA